MLLHDVNLRALRYFAMTAETGTISEAAKRLNISQPSVSAAIQQLEDAYEVQLFFRIPTKGIQLTPDGQRFLEHARHLLAHSDQFKYDVGSISQSLSGEITIGTFLNLTPAITAELVGAFHLKYPNIRVHLHDVNQHEILAGLASGKIEMAITFDLALQSGFSSSVVAKLQPRAILPIDDPLTEEKELSLLDIAQRPFVLMDLPHTNDYFHSLFTQHRIVPRIEFRCRSFEAVRAFVASGLGVSILNIRPAIDKTYSGRKVIMRPIIEPLAPLKIVLLRNKRLKVRPVLNLFADFAAKMIPGISNPLGE